MRISAVMDYGPIVPDMETSTCPRRMAANDGHTYVVKMLDGGRKARFNEYVAANIARNVGLSVAEPVVIHIDSKFIGRTPGLQRANVSPGPYFATRFYNKAYDMHGRAGPRPMQPQITNLEEVPAFVAFDVFVHNKDRNDGNTLLVPSNGGRAGYRYLIIDHGHCFGGPAWDSDTAASLPYETADIPWQTSAISGEGPFRDPIDKMAQTGQADVDSAKDGLPSDWDIHDSEYGALKRTMSSRDPDKMLDAIRSSKALFPGWRDGLDRWGS